MSRGINVSMTPRQVKLVIITNERGICAGGDVRAHDAYEGEAALHALTNCAMCDVTAECLEVVQPRRSGFTGVCGGKVWRDGRERA